MKRLVMGGLGACLLLMAAGAAWGEVKVDVGHNAGDQATADFKFKEVVSPVATSAATGAKITIVDGVRDEHGGGTDVLNDGKLPDDQDEPESNFFFDAGTDGGRIVLDLGKSISVKQVNTYSWHADERAPQVYSLYAADGAAAGFDAKPGKGVDPAKAGWKLIAKVDTHPKSGDVGGQYGVSISDTKGPLGSYRYLLIAASKTESDDAFGNTFFSEINVIDANELMGPPAVVADRAGIKVVQIDGGKYTATIDTTETPDLTGWAEKELAPVVAEWYPKIVKMLPSEGYAAPTHFTITFKKDMQGVAYTIGTRVSCAAAWFRTTLKGEARGAVVHELVHVVQQYWGVRKGNPHPAPNPVWLVEGMADYIRWYEYEPQSHGTTISKQAFAKANYDGSYRISANFLQFVVTKYDKDLIRDLDVAMREGKYGDEVWVKLTGKSVKDLGAEWKGALGKELGVGK